MIHILYYLTAFFLLCPQSRAVALPQAPAPSSQLLPTTAAEITSTASSTTVEATLTSATSSASTLPQNDGATDSNNRRCDFETMQDFFNHAAMERLNITVEVQNCQNLCLLTYGVGNPDLSGIGMMSAYTIQIILTVLIGPAYRLLYLAWTPPSKPTETVTFRSFVKELERVQTAFSAANGFFVLACAVSSIVRLHQNPAIFEIAEMQAMAFLQVNSILVMFFCLIRSMPRRTARVLLYTVVFAFVLAVLSMSHLNGGRRTNWRLASDGCAQESTDYDVITPILYPPWAVAVIAVVGTVGFWLQSLKRKFQRRPSHQVLFQILMSLWVLLIGLMIAGMVTGLVMMWRQRNHLHSVAGEQFEDDDWGFGQIAALFIWAPIPVEIFFVLHDLVQRSYPKEHFWKIPLIGNFLHRNGVNGEQTTPHDSQNEDKNLSQSTEVGGG
ncbi:hypothetical protein EPUS_07932 [Endocarpon pusillum Z07020]|uniref:Uncharacterized protein n=1 Tax=Endocarpon pusillum (strain Z07020 / HMAS-L-300199) TaxID=1263415 RepID=U1GY15_ENDPU|nr:uncharacterized protein EPUS_07932 [Endocarpon pusillum Z07020]ERF77026.1 hypothetical protein EPUS_07932 [Endocarpon pusillum Z07020]